jgi:23S rRNA pseudouridine2605 synthase
MQFFFAASDGALCYPSRMAQLRIQKIIAAAGVCSRREAETLISSGEVTINGKIATLGQKADGEQDHIKVFGKLIRKAENRVVVALFKPRDVWCPTRPLGPEDEKTNATVYDLIPKIKERVFPVGKLDADTEGLLLLTNDGELSKRLLDTKYEVPKTWRFKVDGHVEDKKLNYMTKGMKIEGKRLKVTGLSVERVLDGKMWVQIDTTEVQNRLIRKAFEKLSHPIDKAQRICFGGIDGRKMERGQYRYLTSAEVKKLKEWVGL